MESVEVGLDVKRNAALAAAREALKAKDADVDAVQAQIDALSQIGAGEKRATLRELNAFESMRADAIASKIVGEGEQPGAAVITKVYALCSVRSFNGSAVNPMRNSAEFTALAEQIGLGEMNVLMGAFVETFDPPEGPSLKNAPAAAPVAP